MSNPDQDRRLAPSDDAKRRGAGPRPVSDRGVAIFFAILAAALVLGYLLVTKLANISGEEDCALAHRYDCGAVVAPGR